MRVMRRTGRSGGRIVSRTLRVSTAKKKKKTLRKTNGRKDDSTCVDWIHYLYHWRMNDASDFVDQMIVVDCVYSFS